MKRAILGMVATMALGMGGAWAGPACGTGPACSAEKACPAKKDCCGGATCAAEQPAKAVAATPATQPAKPVNTKCPIMGEAVNPKVTVVQDGKTVAFCCKQCIGEFQKDPAKYMKNLK